MAPKLPIRVVIGLLPACGGTASFDGHQLIGLPPTSIAQVGLGPVPEGRQIFSMLTVEGNLLATAAGYASACSFWRMSWPLRRIDAALGPNARHS